MESETGAHHLGKHPMPIIINSPCDADWSAMTKTEAGKFCGQCSKEVVDLSDKTTDEAERIIKESDNSICTRLRPNQIVPQQNQKRKLLHLLFALLITFGSALFSLDLKAQKAVDQFKYQSENEFQDVVIIKGRVTDDEGESVPFTNVYFTPDSGKVVGTAADVEGYYSLQIPKSLINSVDLEIKFSSIGYVTSILKINYTGELDRFKHNLQFQEQSMVMGGPVIICTPGPPLLPHSDFGKTTLSGDALRRDLRH